ncbi:MAG: RHS repeat-associated core domain-containing protein, partial [Flavipsychrobacter sp.]
DPVGNITKQEDAAQQTVYFSGGVASPNNDYTYDALYRLIVAQGREHAGNNGAVTNNDSSRMGIIPTPVSAADTAKMRTYIQYYTYDAVGNMLEMKHTATGGVGNWTRDFTISGSNNKTLSTTIGSNGTGTESYTYDTRGNITAGFNHLNTLTYNELNRLEVVVGIGGAATTWYQYDASGERVRKVTVDASSNTEKRRLYDGQWELYTHKTASTTDLTRETLHVMDDKARIALVDTPTFNTTGSGERQNLRYQFSNHLSTATLELDFNAANISYEEYYPFGSTSFQSGRSAAEVSLKRYRYTAKERDEETGLYYHGARYYAPWLGRWIAVDPINNETYNLSKGQPNKNIKRDYIELTASSYEYCYANPVRFSDPTGEQVPAALQKEINNLEKYTQDKIDQVKKKIDDVKQIPEKIKKTASDKAADITDATASAALAQTAKEIYKDVGNIKTEGQKQAIFKKDADKTVAILLYEFATGTGKEKRTFDYNTNPFVNKFLEGRVLPEIMKNFYQEVQKEHLTYEKFKELGKEGKSIKFGLSFSPDQTSLRDSLKKHLNSNLAQFFIGGASISVKPGQKDGTIIVTVSNDTSRRSLLVHLGENYKRTGNDNEQQKPLSTIKQELRFQITIDPSKFSQK